MVICDGSKVRERRQHGRVACIGNISWWRAGLLCSRLVGKLVTDKNWLCSAALQKWPTNSRDKAWIRCTAMLKVCLFWTSDQVVNTGRVVTELSSFLCALLIGNGYLGDPQTLRSRRPSTSTMSDQNSLQNNWSSTPAGGDEVDSLPQDLRNHPLPMSVKRARRYET